MTYSATRVRRNPPIITPFSRESIGLDILTSTGQGLGSSAAWLVANKAVFVPFTLELGGTVVKMFASNGGVLSGNADIGIYNLDGTKIVTSGSTAQAGVSVLQVFDIADTTLVPGSYYMAYVLDNTTAQTIRSAIPQQNEQTFFGVKAMAAAFPLPATATFAAPSGSQYLTWFGLSFVTLF